MFTAFESRQLSDLTIAEKRNLVKVLRESIKDQVAINKVARLSIKQNKENAKKDKLQKSIIAAQEKLAKLQAKLAS
jgi:hypothetical protein